MTHLAPHPWDSIGKPPPVGPSYEAPPDLIDVAAVAAAMVDLREIDRLRGDIERAEDDMDEIERRVAPILKDVEKVYPKLAEAIRDQPWHLDGEDEIRAFVKKLPAVES